MEAKELRIGNWVFGDDNRIVIIEPNTYQDVHNGVFDFTPIPLTEEILLKCGLNRDSEGWYLSAEYKLYNPLNNNNLPSSNYYVMMCRDKLVTVKATIYLHQLQNLYFALTGNELTYTP